MILLAHACSKRTTTTGCKNNFERIAKSVRSQSNTDEYDNAETVLICWFLKFLSNSLFPLRRLSPFLAGPRFRLLKTTKSTRCFWEFQQPVGLATTSLDTALFLPDHWNCGGIQNAQKVCPQSGDSNSDFMQLCSLSFRCVGTRGSCFGNNSGTHLNLYSPMLWELQMRLAFLLLPMDVCNWSCLGTDTAWQWWCGAFVAQLSVGSCW